ncbi:MAG: shikimate dehydrogenase [Isosphaeraceae bacterium]|nr:shikimate dehydrogenase [Isosphaeraceae bacterium]
MICVTIGRGRHSSLLAEWKAAAEAGAELVELRIDCLRREPDLKRLLAEKYTPIIYTIRRGVDGGLWRGDEEKRLRFLREAIVKGVDYVDLEADIAPSIRRFGKTKRIISVHNFKKTPEDLEKLARELKDLDADIVKIATLAHSVADASRILQMVAQANKSAPTIGLAMGGLGFFTRILGAKFGAPFTYSGFNPDRTFAPGQPFFQDLKRDYFYDQINADTEVYGVIGDPIAHSLSPAIHNAGFRHLGLNKVLVPFQIPAGTLKESLQALKWLDLKGFSVTIPHKEAIIPLLDRIDKSVERTGACNTVVQDKGQWVGHNTDYRAAMESLEEALGGEGPGGASPLMDKQVLILGAGGVARTIAFGLVRRGAGVTVCNRNDERAARLAEEVGCRSTSWGMRAGTLHDILINCTPVGMHPEVDETPVPPAAFKPGTVVFDTVYHPENTLFLKLARERNCTTISGVDMFVRQAALQFQYYTGRDAPEGLMREVVRRKLSAARD